MQTTQSSIQTHGRDALPRVRRLKDPKKGGEEEIEQKISEATKISYCAVGKASRFAFRQAYANRDGSPTRAGRPCHNRNPAILH